MLNQHLSEIVSTKLSIISKVMGFIAGLLYETT